MRFDGLWAIMLNNRAKKGSQKVLLNLNIHAGDIIADIGSGGGYYSFEMARLTGSDGKVYAVDTNKALLTRIENTARKMQFQNIETVNSSEDSCNLPKDSCDLIFMRNVFHHIKNPALYFQDIKERIKPEGILAILDWKSTAGGFVGRSGHCTEEEEIKRILTSVGFRHVKSIDGLDDQSFDVFSPF